MLQRAIAVAGGTAQAALRSGRDVARAMARIRRAVVAGLQAHLQERLSGRIPSQVLECALVTHCLQMVVIVLPVALEIMQQVASTAYPSTRFSHSRKVISRRPTRPLPSKKRMDRLELCMRQPRSRSTAAALLSVCRKLSNAPSASGNLAGWWRNKASPRSACSRPGRSSSGCCAVRLVSNETPHSR